MPARASRPRSPCTWFAREGCALFLTRYGAEDRVPRRNGLELSEGCLRINWDVRARSGSELQVALQDRRAARRIDLLEPHSFAVAMAKYGVSAGGPDVGDPVGALAKHRDEVTLSLVVRHNDGE